MLLPSDEKKVFKKRNEKNEETNTKNDLNSIIKTLLMVPLLTQSGALYPLFVFSLLLLLVAGGTMVVIKLRAFVSTDHNILPVSIPLGVKWLLIFCQVKKLQSIDSLHLKPLNIMYCEGLWNLF